MKRDRVDDILRDKIVNHEAAYSDVASETDGLWERMQQRIVVSDTTSGDNNISLLKGQSRGNAKTKAAAYYGLAAGIAAVLVCALAIMLWPRNTFENKVGVAPAHTQEFTQQQYSQNDITAQPETIAAVNHILKKSKIKHVHVKNVAGISAGMDNEGGEALDAQDPSTFGMYTNIE